MALLLTGCAGTVIECTGTKSCIEKLPPIKIIIYKKEF